MLDVPAAVTKSWRLLPHDRSAVEHLSAELRVAPVVAQLLLNRGVTVADTGRRFLDTPLSGLHAPDALPGACQAADLLFEAVQAGRRVCVYGDYDVDGTAGTAILLQALRLLGAKADFYVPHRLEEGYGLNREALRQIAEGGASLVVTVDCGICSVEEAIEASRLGLQLIVTDHHEYKPALPDAAVLVHPRLPGTGYPFGGLSGAAVAFKVAWALARRASGGGEKVLPRFREFLLDAVALAALGVVADVVPLLDENRILVRHGLNRLRQQPPPGLQALCAAAGLAPGADLRASDIGFKLAPRLNAAGRLGCARLVVDLLTETRPELAADRARYLEEQNAKRQALERRMVAEAREMIESEGRQDDAALVLSRMDWHAGVLGIVAGRLAELYGKPSCMIALQPSRAVTAPHDAAHARVGLGSGRSIPGFALHEALRACDDVLLSHGGHHAAAGFRILPENIDAFREKFCQHTAALYPGGTPTPSLVLDAEVPLGVLTFGLLRDLDRLEPYGADNRKPIFLAGGLSVVGEPRKVGNGERHLSFRVGQSGTVLKAIAWGVADRAEELMSAGGNCSLAFTPKRNEWQGRSSIDLEVVDFQAGKETRLQ
jgi:single-stranded-DNA-specific exonuclease